MKQPTLHSHLKENGLKAYKPRKIPKPLNDLQKKKRMDFSKKWVKDDFKSWGFEDEFMVELGGMPNQQNSRV